MGRQEHFIAKTCDSRESRDLGALRLRAVSDKGKLDLDPRLATAQAGSLKGPGQQLDIKLITEGTGM
jgi:hypothetical protein